MAKYHPYVFDSEERRFIGHFEQMYQDEREKGFDSWHQDDLRPLDRKICISILNQFNFSKILDVGCGKGAFTQFLKKHNNHVSALDISPTAIERAKTRYPDIDFIQADVSNPATFQNAGGWGRRSDCLHGTVELYQKLATITQQICGNGQICIDQALHT